MAAETKQSQLDREKERVARLLRDEEEVQKFAELNQKEQTKTLECVMKVMNR